MKSGCPFILYHSIKFIHKYEYPHKNLRNSIVGKRWKYTMAIWKGKPKNANKIVMHHTFVFWIWGDSFLFKTVVRCYLRLLFQTGTFYMYLCQVVCCFGRMKTYFIAIKCNLNVCMCAMWWWWLRIINVGTKATNMSVPSDLSHFTTLSLSQLFSILSLSVPFQSPLCMIPFHFGHCFQVFFSFCYAFNAKFVCIFTTIKMKHTY